LPKSYNQKLKILYLAKFLREKSDEDNPVTVAQMLEELSRYGIKAERKSIYSDIEALNSFGLDIVCVKGKSTGYFMSGRDFELAELKLLVDSVQSSKFITLKKSQQLIKKIEGLCSENNAKLLHRQVYVLNRVKTMNESIYYNVDIIHRCIDENKKISFNYYEYTVSKEKLFKKNGKDYIISPFALTWDDENYYLLGYDSEAGIIKHYRVDKMAKINSVDEQRDGFEKFESFDLASYSKSTFSMFGGDMCDVKLRFENSLCGVVIDRFGKEVIMVPDSDNHFVINVKVSVSPMFFGWLFSFGNKVEILSPQSVKDKMKDTLKSVAKNY